MKVDQAGPGLVTSRTHVTTQPEPVRTKFDTKQIPPGFMNTDITIGALEALSERLNHSDTDQHSMDSLYSDFCSVITDEMNRCLPQKTFLLNGNRNKKRRAQKPWWSEEMTNKWNDVCIAERDWKRCHREQKSNYKHIWRDKRRAFDKAVQRAKRRHWWHIQEQLLHYSCTDKQNFWREIGKTGIAKERSSRIPSEVVLEDGSVSSNLTDVLDRWRNAFYNLLNVAPSGHQQTSSHDGQLYRDDNNQADDMPFNTPSPRPRY